MAVPVARMYLEGARFLRARIQHLNDDGDADADPKGGGEDDDDDNAVLRSAVEDVKNAHPCLRLMKISQQMAEPPPL